MSGVMQTIELPAYVEKFVAVDHFEAIYTTEQGEQSILVEARTMIDAIRGTSLVYTVIDGQPVRSTNIYSLVIEQPGCISLSIVHHLDVLWNGSIKRGELTEIIYPTPDDKSYPYSVILSLIIDDVTYRTTPCDILQDAVWELQEILEADGIDLWFRTCYHCNFSSGAFLWPISDRDGLRCYRDSAEALKEVKQKAKYASREARHAGVYFVNAFHRCAAWEQLRPRSDYVDSSEPE